MTPPAEDDRWHAWRRRGPVGLWRSAAGSFAALAGDELWFGPDGEGWLASRSPLFGDQRLRFRWRPFDDGEIELQVTEWPEALREPAAEDEPPGWQRLRWERCEVQTDFGARAGLREVGCEGFWLVPDPLVWAAPLPPAG